jgi:hypothetical protein
MHVWPCLHHTGARYIFEIRYGGDFLRKDLFERRHPKNRGPPPPRHYLPTPYRRPTICTLITTPPIKKIYFLIRVVVVLNKND